MKNPSNVIAGFEESVGGTFFHLNDMQVRHSAPGVTLP